jgi:hypothetical protein
MNIGPGMYTYKLMRKGMRREETGSLYIDWGKIDGWPKCG